MIRLALSPIILLLTSTFASAAPPEFNWIPSGGIAVGDRASEAASNYEADGEVVKRTLAYRDAKPQEIIGRKVTGPERFVIHPASYRGGPAPTHLVIVRRFDTAAPPPPVTVLLGDKELGRWEFKPPPGDRRLTDALFVIPKSAFVQKDVAPADVPVTLRPAADEPALSLGYRFYATRDWDVLGEELAGDVQVAAAKNTPFSTYLNGLLKEADHDWSGALGLYRVKYEGNPELERLARVAARRMQLRLARADALKRDPTGDRARPDFVAHYRLAALAGAWGCWEDARAEAELALLADPTHADATYRLAEAMEYCRLPVEQWAPLFERAGMLGESDRMRAAARDGLPPPVTRVEDILIAVHPGAVTDLCGQFSQASLNALQRDWRYVEQQVYGASRGAWKLRTHLRVHGPGDPPWVMQAGWIFLPPDESVPVVGTYDYSIGTAEYGSSHAGGVDCGVSGSGGAQIGPTRGWEVLLHEWNHEFDWVCVFGEQVPGYPPTHDSDGCGKQPIVSMGCGHRSSMRYYINPAQYRRHEASTPVPSPAFVGQWQVGPIVEAPRPDDASPEGLAKWLVDAGRFTTQRIEALRKEWEQARKDEQQRAAKPPVVASQPPPRPVPDWPEFLRAQWNRVKLLSELRVPNEAQVIGGEHLQTFAPLRTIDVPPDFVDARTVHPQSADKCVAYFRTYIHADALREVRLWIGYNDCAAVWLNGRPIHSGEYYACAKWEDQNRPGMLAQSGTLLPGWNCLAVKLERGGGDWGFAVHLTDFENRPVEGLRVKPELMTGETPNRYVPPAAGKYYRWADVREDWLERLPRLGSAELAQITGLPGLTLAEHRFWLQTAAPAANVAAGGSPAVAGSRILPPDASKDALAADVELNNHLNWDREAAAALRYVKDGQPRDLLLVRPEYVEDFLLLLTGDGPPADRVLGYVFIPQCEYATTPGRSARAVVVVEARLPDYPADDLDLLRP